MEAKNIGIKKKMDLAYKLISENGGFLRNTIFQQTRDQHLAEDIFQDFFMSIVKNPVSNNIQNLDAYLKRLVRNDVIDAIRRQKTITNNKDKYYRHRKINMNFVTNPADLLIKKEQKKQIYSIARKNLPPSQFRAISLRYDHGFTISETAKKMKIDSRSVSRYLSVGLKKLNEDLSSYKDDLYECA